MQYEEFKEKLIQALPDYLPAKYHDWEISCHEVVKVNGTYETLFIMPQGGYGGTPNLYVDDLYGYYRHCRCFEQVCQKAAAVFVTGMDYAARFSVKDVCELPKDRIIYVLIPQKGNERLLANVPHRLTMDLAVIYRIALEAENGGMDSAVISSAMAEELGLSEEELYHLAMENTPVIMGLEIKRSEGLPFMVTNKLCISGATTILYPGVLAELAEELEHDLYILPSSLQEVFIVPDIGQDVKQMNDFIKNANETVVGKEEILADHVYYYHRETDQVSIPK